MKHPSPFFRCLYPVYVPIFSRCVRDQEACIYSSKKRTGRRLILAGAANAGAATAPSYAAVPSEGTVGGGGGGSGGAGGSGGGGVGLAIGGEVTSAPLAPGGHHHAGPPGWGVGVALPGYGGGGGAASVGGFFPQPHFGGGGGSGNSWAAVAGNTGAVMVDPSGESGSSCGGGGGGRAGAFWGSGYSGNSSGEVGGGMAAWSNALSGVAGAGAAKMLHRGIAAAFRAVSKKIYLVALLLVFGACWV